MILSIYLYLQSFFPVQQSLEIIILKNKKKSVKRYWDYPFILLRMFSIQM